MARGEQPAKSPVATAEAAGEGRRERRRREVRDRLFETAMELFLEQSYECTTMDEIANRADVARTTVFNHYPRKSEFLQEWGARRRAKVAEALARSQLDDKPLTVILERYMQLMAQLNEEHRAETMELLGAAMARIDILNKPPLAGTLGKYIRRAQKRGQVRADVDADQAGLILAASYFTTLVGWAAQDPPPYALGEALSGVVRLILRGIESPTTE